MTEPKRPSPPKPGKQLYDNLFQGLDQSEIINRISDGINAVIANSNRLLEDVKILVKSNRLASAGFLLTTADEEMAKVYILLDMCRLDFTRHESLLKNLCRGFYDHVIKHAYRRIIQSSDESQDMLKVKAFWTYEITKFWPSGPESGEPDFLHDTYLHRELSLYVDFIDYNQSWHIPDNTINSYRFEKEYGEDAISKSKIFFERIQTSSNKGFFDREILSIVNDEFRNNIISEKTATAEIQRIYKKIQSRIPTDIQADFENCSLSEWPLYHCPVYSG